MAKRSGSRKGTPFEREIAKEISWWWSWGERDDLVWRTANSGGRATERAKTNLITKYQFGDLGPLDPCIYPLFDLFLWEMKRGYNKDLDILELIDLPKHLKKVPILRLWWEKAEEDRKLGERKDKILILQRDNRKKLVVLSEPMFFNIETLHCEYEDKLIQVEGMCILDFSEFFAFFEPEMVPKLLSCCPSN
jgi:hypothetical protein